MGRMFKISFLVQQLACETSIVGSPFGLASNTSARDNCLLAFIDYHPVLPHLKQDLPPCISFIKQNSTFWYNW